MSRQPPARRTVVEVTGDRAHVHVEVDRASAAALPSGVGRRILRILVQACSGSFDAALALRDDLIRELDQEW